MKIFMNGKNQLQRPFCVSRCVYFCCKVGQCDMGPYGDLFVFFQCQHQVASLRNCSFSVLLNLPATEVAAWSNTVVMQGCKPEFGGLNYNRLEWRLILWSLKNKNKKTFWLAYDVQVLDFCQYGCQCCSWVLSDPLCQLCFRFSSRPSALVFYLPSHHVKTHANNILFIDYIIVGLLVYLLILKAEQHKGVVLLV